MNFVRVALAYDRVNKWGGAERVLLALHEIFPNAPLFTAVYNSETSKWAEVFPKVIPSFLQKIPFAKTRHEFLGTFTPLAFETFDFSDYDLVISVTSEAAKGIITKPPAMHICYCLTPTRYLWSAYELYFRNPILKFTAKSAVSYLRYWDKIAAQRPDVMVGISREVCKRIKKYYGRESELIYPPVDLEKYEIRNTKYEKRKEDFFLVVSRLIPYKRVDLAVEAFNELGVPLTIVGTGSEEGRLKRMAKKNIRFVGELTDEKLADYYSKCSALIFPQEEDFGLVTVEAQAAGTPVIAYKKGGALDTIVEGKTGVFFTKQNKVSLIGAIKEFKERSFDRKVIMNNANKFSKEIFKNEFLKLIKDVTR